MSSARPVTAASGSPPAMPLARVIRSGTTPSSSQANHEPVRQKPVCTSSAMKTAPDARHHSATAGRNPAAGTTKPPSPWIGSSTTHATFDAPTYFSMAAIDRAAASTPLSPSRYGYDVGTRYTSGANGPNPSLYG